MKLGSIFALLSCLAFASTAHAGLDACALPQLVRADQGLGAQPVPAEGGTFELLAWTVGSCGWTLKEESDAIEGLERIGSRELGEGTGRYEHRYRYKVLPNPGAERATELFVIDQPQTEKKLFPIKQAGAPAVTNDPSLLGAERTCGAIKMNTIKPGSSFKYDAYVLSPNRRFKIIYQADGNFVLYKGTGEWIWDIQKPNKGGRLDMQKDGNLVSYDAKGQWLWKTGTHANPNAYLAIQDDGNIVIYKANTCKALWARSLQTPL